MAINYNDSRFTDLEKDKQSAINKSNSTYDGLINDSDKYYQNLINQSKDWADKQADIQNQQTQFTIDKIEQQKDLANKDYTKEQKGAYQDYMKQSNAYGSNMQAMGQQGLGGSGWSETIQSGFYNTYQNRYAQARESYNEIVMNYNNNIKEAQLQNSSALAEIYANAQKEQLELALESFSVIKDLELNKLNTSIQLDNEYNDRWREIESQINTENSLAEQIRQYNASLAEQKRQANMDNAYKQKQLALAEKELAQQQSQWKAEFDAKYGETSGGTLTGSSGSGSGGSSSKKGGGGKSSGGGSSKSFGSSKLTNTANKIASGTKKSSSSSAKVNMKAVEKLTKTINKTAKATPLISKKVVAKDAINYAYKTGAISEEDVKILAKRFDLD